MKFGVVLGVIVILIALALAITIGDECTDNTRPVAIMEVTHHE